MLCSGFEKHFQITWVYGRYRGRNHLCSTLHHRRFFNIVLLIKIHRRTTANYEGNPFLDSTVSLKSVDRRLYQARRTLVCVQLSRVTVELVGYEFVRHRNRTGGGTRFVNFSQISFMHIFWTISSTTLTPEQLSSTIRWKTEFICEDAHKPNGSRFNLMLTITLQMCATMN